MSSKKGHFLVVKIRKRNSIGFTIPVPIGFVTFCLRAASKMPIMGDKAKEIRLALKLSVELINELRKCGRWDLVEVQNDEAEVMVSVK